jgi:hypothetical protein
MANVTKPVFKERYDNFIGGKFVAPVKDNISTTSQLTEKYLLKQLVLHKKM